VRERRAGWNVAGELNVDLEQPTVSGSQSGEDGSISTPPTTTVTLFFSSTESIRARQRAHRDAVYYFAETPAKIARYSPWSAGRLGGSLGSAHGRFREYRQSGSRPARNRPA